MNVDTLAMWGEHGGLIGLIVGALFAFVGTMFGFIVYVSRQIITRYDRSEKRSGEVIDRQEKRLIDQHTTHRIERAEWMHEHRIERAEWREGVEKVVDKIADSIKNLHLP